MRHRPLLGFALALSATGCLSLPEKVTLPWSSRGPVQVKSDGACLQLGELQQGGKSASGLRQELNELLAANKQVSARALANRFPEQWEEILRSGTNDAAELLIRELHKGAYGDSSLSQLSAIASDRKAAHDALLAGNPGVAISKLESAIARGGSIPESRLLLAEAKRRAEKVDEGIALWTQAVEEEARLTTRDRFHPVFWERASYLKPSRAQWPQGALESWRRAVELSLSSEEATLWTAIGTARAERGEPHAALAAFKKAESYLAAPHEKAILAPAEARLLAHMGQGRAATTLLVPLAETVETPSGAAAAALLGSLRYGEGADEQSLTLLRRAITKGPSQWPGREESLADLALVELANGHEAEGLARLAEARQLFEKNHKYEQLIQSWENEERYWTRANQPDQAARAKKKAEECQRSVTSP